MNVLIVGSGGREHALAWKAAQSPRVATVFVAPGNAGTAGGNSIRNIDIAATNTSALLRFARDNDIGLTIIGPEQPLVNGIVDEFQRVGLRCFGPTAAAAQLEGSKAFMKQFLVRHDIPTAAYAAFTEPSAALDYIEDQDVPLVIKADGLAAGKGVVVAQTREEARAAVHSMLSDARFGDAGRRIVVEQFLSGEEASFIAIVDGTKILPLATSQDHKARDDGDSGPNTGGMGAYSPAPVVSDEIHELIMRTIMQPTVDALVAEGTPYRGFLYAGVMIDSSGLPRVLEFNCRFGDPETQPIMARLQSDLIALCDAAIDGRLDEVEAHWDPRAALGVVLAAAGYPDKYQTGLEISGLDDDFDNTIVFHAGTASTNGKVVTSGGRVLCVVGLGDTIAEAQQLAYERCRRINWPGVYYRRDIGYRGIG